ncbi:MAG: hypothetical protein E4G92_00710 [Bacteroidia bacterium]|nr:MAG: hypothetical protein E4G92_00710 [Bacteroidia bacterium]
MKIRILVTCIICLTGVLTGNAQELPLLTEKQGTFKILSRTDYTAYDCGYTKAEITANLQRITELVNVVRQNPVLRDLKGFEGRARIYNVSCKDVGGYGVPSRISFEFCSWFRKKDGTEAYNAIEPPEWSLYINKAVPLWLSSYIHNARHSYFTVPLKKETVEQGIDVYDGEYFVIYDPSRPQYWIHVTVNEAFAAVRENLNSEKDQIAAGYLKEYVEKEYAEIPEGDRNKPAYFGGGVSRVSATPGAEGMENIFPYIMKVNPEYWNRNLPKSAIQLINFRSIQNKEYLRKQREEYLQNYSISSHVALFEEEFDMDDIRALVSLIGK